LHCLAQKNHQAAFMHFLTTNRTANQVAGGFGLYTEQATQEFVKQWLPTFDVMLLSERYVHHIFAGQTPCFMKVIEGLKRVWFCYEGSSTGRPWTSRMLGCSTPTLLLEGKL
jgi:hypothetical protein